MKKKIGFSGIFALLLLVFSLQAQAIAPGPAPTPPPAPDPYAACIGVTKAIFWSSEYLEYAIRGKFFPFTCGTIHVGGWNMDAVYSASDTRVMLMVLQGNPWGWGEPPTIEMKLNQEYVAAQLSMLQFGGADWGAKKTPLKCYGFTTSLLLGNGTLITPETQLGVLFNETYLAFKDRRYDDYLPLWNFYWRLNGGDLSYPHYNYKGMVDDAMYCCEEVTDQGNGIVNGSHCQAIKDWQSYKCQGYSFSCTGEMVSPAGVAGCKVVP
jgi:hypothetical protein